MKPKNLTFIPLAFLMGCLVHLLLSGIFFMSKTSTNSYFSTSVMLMLGYLFLKAISFAVLVFGPLDLAQKHLEIDQQSLNWWWHLYLGGWGLVALVILEDQFLKAASIRMEVELITFTVLFFFIKNIFLIPSYFSAKGEGSKQYHIKLLACLELFILVLIFGLFQIAGRVVPDFGS